MSTKRLKQCLIFGGGIKSPNNDQIGEHLDDFDKTRDFTPSEEKSTPSAYVQVFESMSTISLKKEFIPSMVLSTAMVRTVLEAESDLLSLEEVGILRRFSKLCCKLTFLSHYCH
jgi:hypothetical protein